MRVGFTLKILVGGMLCFFISSESAADPLPSNFKKMVGIWSGDLVLTGVDSSDPNVSSCDFKPEELPAAEVSFKIARRAGKNSNVRLQLTLKDGSGRTYLSDLTGEGGGPLRYRHKSNNTPSRKDFVSRSYYFADLKTVNKVRIGTVVFSVFQQLLSEDPTGNTYCGMTYEGNFTKN